MDGMAHEDGGWTAVLGELREQQALQANHNEFLKHRLDELLNQMRGVLRDGEALEHRLAAMEVRGPRRTGETRETTPDASLPARFGGDSVSLRDFIHSVRNVYALQPLK